MTITNDPEAFRRKLQQAANAVDEVFEGEVLFVLIADTGAAQAAYLANIQPLSVHTLMCDLIDHIARREGIASLHPATREIVDAARAVLDWHTLHSDERRARQEQRLRDAFAAHDAQLRR